MFISTFRNALNYLTNICQILLLSSPSQEEKGMRRGVFCLGIFQIITYAHIYMLVSVYVREDKVIEKCLYVCCWRWQGFVMVILGLWSLLLDVILGRPWKKCFLFHWQAESLWQLGCRWLCITALVSDQVCLIDMVDLMVGMELKYPNLVNSGRFERRRGIFWWLSFNLVNYVVNRRSQKLQRALHDASGELTLWGSYDED